MADVGQIGVQKLWLLDNCCASTTLLLTTGCNPCGWKDRLLCRRHCMQYTWPCIGGQGEVCQYVAIYPGCEVPMMHPC